MNKILFAILALLATIPTVHATPETIKNRKQEILFIENKGQLKDEFGNQRSDIAYSVVTGPGLTLFAAKGQLIYQFAQQSAKDSATRFYRVEVALAGANKAAKIIADTKQDYTESHILRTNGKQQVFCNSFSRITYQEIYPGIDWVLYNSGGKLKHEFIVHENGDARSIQLIYKGATQVSGNKDGTMQITTPLGTITEAAPVTLSNGQLIPSNYVINNNSVTYFTSGRTSNMVIDPYVNWATYLGASAHDWCNDIVTDQTGKLYITGSTYSSATIATSGAFDTTFHAPNSCFLQKFDTLGHRIWGTYVLAGEGYVLDADSFGHIYLAGDAFYRPMQNTAYIASFDTSGRLKWDTSVYDNYNCYGKSVASDRFGNVYLFEHVTDNVFIVDRPYIYKFDSSGNIKWARRPIGYTMSSDRTYASAIATDTTGNIFISGFTTNSSGITTTGAYQTTRAYSFEPYIMKLDSAGTKIWATYYSPSYPGSGSSADPNDIKVDANGDVYVSVNEQSASSSTRAGFIAKFNNTGTRLLWADSMYNTALYSLSLDRNNKVYTVGKKAVTSYDVVARVYDISGIRLSNWTYHSTTSLICFNGVTAGVNGNYYVCGQIYDTIGYVGAGAHQPAFGGMSDGLILRFAQCSTTVAAIGGPNSVCLNQNITLTNATTGGTWSSSNTSIATVHPSTGVVTGVALGLANITYAVPSPCGPVNATYSVMVNPVSAGCFVAVGEQAISAPAFSMSPNPSAGEVTLLYNNDTREIATVLFTDLAGRKLKETTLVSNLATTLQTDLPAGIYLVTVTTTGKVQTYKLVIE